jgi:hypothetical protein
MDKKLLLEKYIKVAIKKALKEQEIAQKRAEKSMYLVYRFPGLKKVMEDLMSPVFGRYTANISIVAPKPTTFKVELINGQDFSVYYLGNKKWTAKISGKRYHPDNIGEAERASKAIVDLLELNYAPREGEEPQPAPEKGAAPSSPAPSPEDTAKGAELANDLAAAGEEPNPPTETAPPEEEEIPVA